jgi:hypothetical protein
MIIKLADDKKQQLSSLQNLLARPDADAKTKKLIEREIRNIQAGIRGEEEAAYEMKVHWGESKNWMIINDLRIEHGDLVAQIDHLVVNRWLNIWVCESKNFSEGIAINEHGEFSAFFGGKPYGVPSPIEQTNRHIIILQRFFDSGVVKLPTRLGFAIKPTLKGLVLVSKGARISRPKKSLEGLSSIIKNDQLFKTIYKAADDNNPLLLARIVSQDTLEEVAGEIVKHHKPIQFNWTAKFGLSDPVQPSIPDIQSENQRILKAFQQRDQIQKPISANDKQSSNTDLKKPKQKLVCHSCATPIAYNVAKFCWFNKPKFGGNIYCIECQAKNNSTKS